MLASLKTHQLADGSDDHAINPRGCVPLLELDDGTRLREDMREICPGAKRYAL